MVKRDEDRIRRNDAMLAQLTAEMINFSIRAPKQRVTWEQFMPGGVKGGQVTEKRQSGRKRLTAKMRRDVAAGIRGMWAKK